jgi:hypothetical protein
VKKLTGGRAGGGRSGWLDPSLLQHYSLLRESLSVVDVKAAGKVEHNGQGAKFHVPPVL